MEASPRGVRCLETNCFYNGAWDPQRGKVVTRELAGQTPPLVFDICCQNQQTIKPLSVHGFPLDKHVLSRCGVSSGLALPPWCAVYTKALVQAGFGYACIAFRSYSGPDR